MSEIKLNKRQQEAIIHEGSPLLIIAGAGTGKTTVITERIKWLIGEKGIKPSEILALTFTEKAAKEMEERVDIALPMGYTQTWIMTFHGFCEKLLRSEAVQIGLDPGFKIMTEAESKLFINEHLFEFDLSYFRPKGNPTKFIGGLVTHFSRLRDEDIHPDEYIRWIESNKVEKLESEKLDNLAALGSQSDQHSNLETSNETNKFFELAHAYKKYEELKVKFSVMDFADLISNTLRLFRERPNVLAEYQKQFKHILIDEFQDTNYSQNHLAILLAGDDKRITVVADDDQSIYRWRGAAVYNVLDFEKHFPDTKIITLNENYRSSQKILDHSYQLIQNNNPDRLEIKADIDKKLTAANPEFAASDSRIALIWEERVEDECESVVRTIEQLITKKASKLSSDQALSYSDVAILVRANDHAEPITRALARHGIPYQFLGPGRLFRQNEIKDLIAYCKLLTNFEDNHAMYRVLNMPIFKLNGRDVQWLLTQAKKENISVFRILEKLIRKETEYDHGINENDLNRLEKLLQMIQRHLGLISTASPGEVLYYFLEDSGELIKMHDPQNEYEARRVENVSAFFSKLKVYEAQHPDATMNDFVAYLDFLIDAGESPMASQIDWSERNAVNILTIHSAKGLEFDTVFMVSLVNRRFPSDNRKDKIPIPEELVKEPMPQIDPHIAEERRLFYVGMTRAKRNLYLTGAKFYHEASSQAKKLSPFVTDALGEDFSAFMLKVQGSTNDKESAIQVIEDYKTSSDKSEQKLPLQNQLKVSYLSYSQIETFKNCPLHYKLDYLLEIPKLPGGPLTFGNAVHETLRDIYNLVRRGEIVRSVDDMYLKALELYDARWSPVGFSSKDEEKARYEDGMKILHSFLKYDVPRKAEVVDIEKQFNFNIVPDLRIGGRIDRIDRLPSGHLEIIDYKTGQLPERKELENGTKGLQLSIYALAATNKNVLGTDLEKLIFSFHYLEAGERISIERTEDDLREATATILEVREQIENSDFECSNSRVCQMGCDYKLFCG